MQRDAGRRNVDDARVFGCFDHDWKERRYHESDADDIRIEGS